MKIFSSALVGALAVSLMPVLAQQPPAQMGKIHGHVTNYTGQPQTAGMIGLSTDAGVTSAYTFPVDAKGDYAGEAAAGRYLLIYAGPSGDRNIFMIDVAAETAAQLTNGGNNASGVFSPDGQWIAFISLRNNDQADIFIMRPDGSDMRQIVDNAEPDWQPQWEP